MANKEEQKTKGKSRGFKYENTENVGAVVNYLATIAKGLKNRHPGLKQKQ